MAKARVSVTHLTGTSTELGYFYFLVLKEVDGERVLALRLSSHQDFKLLELALEGRNTSYGTPHDTIGNILTAFGGVIEKVVIDEPEVRELGSDEFVATVYIKRNDHLNAVGARKVDAIALALKTSSPIFVEDAVFEKSLIPLQEPSSSTAQRKSVLAWFDSLSHHLLTKH